MREKILNVLAQYPNGLRQRMIASEVGCWTANPDLIKALADMTHEGILTRRYHNDPANMEYYFIWKISKSA